MGIFGKLFGKSDERTALEKFVDGITPAEMSRQVKTVSDKLKVPYAQALNVLLYGRIFTRGLRESARRMPEPFKNDWSFPYDQVLAEVVAFYYFVLIKDHLPKPDEDGEWNDDDDAEEQAVDPRFDALRMSLHLCGELIYSLSGNTIHGQFVVNRALAFSSIQRSKTKNVLDELGGVIMKAWTPKDAPSPWLSLSTPTPSIQASIAAMPLDSIESSCREIFDEKARNPAAF